MFDLQVEKRSEIGTNSLKALRAKGKMPAVLYGGKEKPSNVSISERDFIKVFKVAGESSVVNLSGLGEDKEALIYDVDLDPVSGKPRHADFYIVEKGKKVRVAVPLEFTGVAPAVKELEGVLVKVLHELEIEAMPKDLPHSIAVDISSLVDFNSQILAKDLTLPTGVKLLTKPDEVVATASEAKEEEEAPPAEIDLSAIEVEKRGKEEEGEAGTEAAPAPEKKAEKK